MTCASCRAVSSTAPPSFAKSTSSPGDASLPPARTFPSATTASALYVGGSATRRGEAALSRTSSIVIGLKVLAGPFAPPYLLRSDDAHVPALVYRYRGYVTADDRLVRGRRGLVAGREVHPELHHVHPPAAPGQLLGVVLLVEDPGARGHPLHVTGADEARVAGVVAVSDGSLPGERHRLEAAVRVPAHSALAAREGLEFLRRSVVHQHERADALGRQGAAGEVRGHVESVADPVKRGAAVKGLDAACRARRCATLVRRVRGDLDGRGAGHGDKCKAALAERKGN